MNQHIRALSTSAAILACMGNLAGCAEKPQDNHLRSHALRCISLTSISRIDKVYKIAAKLDHSLESLNSGTECVKLLGVFGHRPQVSFVLKEINAEQLEKFSLFCGQKNSLFIDEIRRPVNTIVNPSYANSILFSEKCNLNNINEERKIGLDDKDIEDLGFFVRQLSMVKKGSLDKLSNVRDEPFEGAVAPKLGTQPQFVSALAGEFGKSPEQAAFFMGVKVEDPPEILCGIVQDFEVSDQTALTNNLSACLFGMN